MDELCRDWGRDLGECRAWYDGYLLEGVGSVYSPRSVVRAMEDGRFGSYWTRTETFEALRRYIEMDLDGLHGKVVELVGGGRVRVNTETYANDMSTFHSADDVLTLLIHLGYLAYDAAAGEAFVPNREVMGEFANSVSDGGWGEVARSIADSESLLEALLAGRSGKVAAGVVVELKWGSSPEEALAQIRERGYAQAFRGTSAESNVVLCGIAYDPNTKRHSCAIERA